MNWAFSKRRIGAFVFAACLASAGGAFAQNRDAPDEPAPLFAQSNTPPGSVPGADGADADTAALVLRLDRVEGELRRANGQIEELQNANHRLEEALKRFREDVEFRLGHGSAPIAGAADPAPAVVAAKPRKSDAFDPNADPSVPGAPKPLGATPPSVPLVTPPMVAKPPAPASAPLDISGRPTPTGPLANNDSGPKIITSGVGFTDGPREQFNVGVDYYRAGQYSEAEAQFKAFLAANPSHAKTPEAIFYLGETYLQRSRPREAAEQYLKLSTDFAKSAKAPEGMMRLGQSLAMMGNNEQACATFAEVGRRYPAAPSTVKKTVDREMQSHHCL